MTLFSFWAQKSGRRAASEGNREESQHQLVDDCGSQSGTVGFLRYNITSIVTSLQSLHHLNHCTTSYITLTLHHLSKMRPFAVAQGFRPIRATDNTIVICRLRTLARSLHHFNNASPQWLHPFKNTSPQSLHHLNRYITSIATSL